MKRFLILFGILWGAFSCQNGKELPDFPLPELSLSDAVVYGTYADVSCSVLDDVTILESGFYYGVNEDLANASFIKADVKNYLFSATLSDLKINATYYYRGYITNGKSSVYSDVKSFYVSDPNVILLPTVSTSDVSDYGLFEVVLGGKVDDDGGSAIISKGIVWSEQPDPTIEKSTVVSSGKGKGSFVCTIKNISFNKKYYYRAYATNSAGMAYGEEKSFNNSSTNLSASGTANCYIIPEAGWFCFDASVIGNGSAGIIENAGFHTSSASVPSSVNTVGQSLENSIDNISLCGDFTYDPSDKKVYFYSNGRRGSAIMNLVDEADNILWSWHLWFTETPQDQEYINYAGKKYMVMDRNLGAFGNVSPAYQWGRKDPFWEGYFVSVNAATNRNDIDFTIKNPATFIKEYWLGTPFQNKYLWGEKKTIYDPCPVGYKVAPRDVWTGFTTTGKDSKDISEFNVSGGYSGGWNFIISPDGKTAWYPGSFLIYWSPYYDSDFCVIWSSYAPDNDHPSIFSFMSSDSRDIYVYNSGNTSDSCMPYSAGCSVRCVRE